MGSAAVTCGAAVQKVFQGGAVSDLHAILGITDAAGVLYIGDHIYGDILKSKKAMGWRTMLIVPELQMELRAAERCAATQAELRVLRRLRDAADERMHRLQWTIDSPRCALPTPRLYVGTAFSRYVLWCGLCESVAAASERMVLPGPMSAHEVCMEPARPVGLLAAGWRHGNCVC